MSVGPHVFGDGRVGCWVTPTANLNDKLADRLPRIKALTAIGIRVTDIFLPPEATTADKRLVQEHGLYVALYEPPPHGRGSDEYLQAALADTTRLAVGVAELNIEGVADSALEEYVRKVHLGIRRKKPHLRLRINVVPFKGGYLPADLFVSDPQLYVIVQCYLGNMDQRVAEDEVVRELVAHGIPWPKVSVMYGAHCAPWPGEPRVPALPKMRYRGSIYTDDLLADAGYI